jgi:hypothetical protein
MYGSDGPAHTSPTITHPWSIPGRWSQTVNRELYLFALARMPPPAHYNLLPAFSSQSKSTNPPLKSNLKTLLFRLLIACAAMLVLYRGFGEFSRSAASFLRTGIKPCHSINGTMTTVRNISAVQTLPSHYTLPSGDKIPSIALGTLVRCTTNI